MIHSTGFEIAVLPTQIACTIARRARALALLRSRPASSFRTSMLLDTRLTTRAFPRCSIFGKTEISINDIVD
jgi:hypothetical protein